MINITHQDLSVFAEQHIKSVLSFYSKTSRKQSLNEIDNWIKQILGSNYSFEYLLGANPQQLSDIVELYKSIYTNITSIEVIENIEKKSYTRFATSKSPFKINNITYDAYLLVKKLNIKVCSYCNRNYIYNVPVSSRRTSELDHFYNKTDYPFLALSFYNLIPSCKICNHLKGKSTLVCYNPYNNSFILTDCHKFGIKPKASDYYQDESKFDLVFTHSNSVLNNNFKVFKINELYSEHKDIALDIIKKCYLYNEDYINDLFNRYQGDLFTNREELIGILFSNLMMEEDLGKRPLAKFTKDIIDDIRTDYSF